MFDLCSVFEVQMQLSLVFATVKASEKNLEILCSLVIYAPNFKHDFLSKKSVYNTQRNTIHLERGQVYCGKETQDVGVNFCLLFPFFHLSLQCNT